MNNIERLNEKKITITKDCYLSNYFNKDFKDRINRQILNKLIIVDNQKTIYNDMKKYRMIEEETTTHLGCTLYRIEALKDFADVKAGDKGGWIQYYDNLSQEGDCWVYDNSKVLHSSRVYENAQLRKNTIVYNSADIFGDVFIEGNVSISGASKVFGEAKIYDDVRLEDFAKVYGYAILYGNAKIRDYAEVFGNTLIHGNATIIGCAFIYDKADVFGNAIIKDDARIYGKAMIGGEIKIEDKVNVFNYTDTYLALTDDACIRGDAVIKNVNDIITLRNELDPKRILTYTKSNKMWNEHISTFDLPINEFYGTSDELIKYGADKDVRLAELFETYVTLVKQVEYITSMR